MVRVNYIIVDLGMIRCIYLVSFVPGMLFLANTGIALRAIFTSNFVDYWIFSGLQFYLWKKDLPIAVFLLTC